MSYCNYFALNQSAKRTNYALRRTITKEYKMASFDYIENEMDFINNTYSVQNECNLLHSYPVTPLLSHQIKEKEFECIGITQSITGKARSPSLNSPKSSVDGIRVKMNQIMDKLQIAEHARMAMMQLTEHKKLQMILEFDFLEKTQMLNQK